MPLLDPDLARLWVAASSLADGLRRVVRVAGGGGDDGEHHTVPTLVAALAGVVRVELPGGRPLDLGAGEVALIVPGARHRHARLRSGSAGLFQGFMLGHSDIELMLPDRTWSLAIPEAPARGLLERACLPGCGERQRLAQVRDALAALAGSRASPLTPMPEAVKRMWLFLRRVRLSPISAAELLRASGLAPTRAHLLFRGYFHETPHRLLTRHRLDYACHLLASGAGSVAQVAAACGFRSRRHLTAAFRSAHGVSPRGWSGSAATQPAGSG